MAEIMDEIAEVAKLVLQGRVQQHFAEQVVDVPGRQVVEEIIKGVKAVCPERVCEKDCGAGGCSSTSRCGADHRHACALERPLVTATGGDAEYVKKLIANDMLSSFNRVASEIVFQHVYPETGTSLHDDHAIAIQEDVASEREARGSGHGRDGCSERRQQNTPGLRPDGRFQDSHTGC